MEPVMIPASWPRDDARQTRLVRVDARAQTVAHGHIGQLVESLRAGDVLVVNDAATLPAALRGATSRGEPIEARLAGEVDGGWRAVLFGPGDWRDRTEDRPAPPRLELGSALVLDGLRAVVVAVDPRTPRLVTLRFDVSEGPLWAALYRGGRPVQYSYTAKPLALWHVQTAYAARPWAAEAPSAGFALTWELLLGLKRQGVSLARVTHAAGLSSTGDDALDAALPLSERYDVPAATVQAIGTAKREGGRVIAVGTTVTRALEGAAANHHGELTAGEGTTSLRLGPGSRRQIVDGLVTGVHDAATSHFALLEAFVPRRLLERASAFAEAHGYLGHEFGDAMLILSAPTQPL